jgi:hypothetical protein
MELPDYVCIEVAGYGEKFDPSVQRTEMERGVPKQRLLNTHVMQELSCSLLFKSPADTAAFEAWYFGDIGRIGYFTFTHPRTGATHNGRFKGGDIGTLTPVNNRRHKWRRSATLEYLR